MKVRSNWRNIIGKNGYRIQLYDPRTYDTNYQFYALWSDNRRAMLFRGAEIDGLIELFQELKKAESEKK